MTSRLRLTVGALRSTGRGQGDGRKAERRDHTWRTTARLPARSRCPSHEPLTSRSPQRSRQARLSRTRQNILPAYSRIRRSCLLGRQKQPFPLNRRRLPILSDRRTQSTRWTIIALASPSGPFAVWRRSSGRTPVAIIFVAPRRCRHPPRTSQMSDVSDGLGADREPVGAGRAARAP